MAWLRVAGSVEEFMRRPLRFGIFVETSFVWCASPSLGGAVGWGSPSQAQAERALDVIDTIFHPALAPQMDIVLDGSRFEHVTPGAAMATFEWIRGHLDALRRRIRAQIGVAPPGVPGLLLSGMLPVLAEAYPFEIVSTPEAAYRRVLGDEGDSLCAEIAGYVDGLSQTPPLVRELRALLRARQGNLKLEHAARLLGRSARSLQRELDAATATSFREEQARARIAAVAEWLATSDDKIAVIAARVGLSENGLNRLVRDRIRTTVTAWRERLRAR